MGLKGVNRAYAGVNFCWFGSQIKTPVCMKWACCMAQVFVEGLPELFAPFGSLCLVKAELLCAQDDRCVMVIMMMVITTMMVTMLVMAAKLIVTLR